jgi:hypothetical protein
MIALLLLLALRPDVALIHAAMVDRAGNYCASPPRASRTRAAASHALRSLLIGLRGIILFAFAGSFIALVLHSNPVESRSSLAQKSGLSAWGTLVPLPAITNSCVFSGHTTSRHSSPPRR